MHLKFTKKELHYWKVEAHIGKPKCKSKYAGVLVAISRKLQCFKQEHHQLDTS